MNNIEKLKLFDNIISIEEVKKGYKKRLKYIVKTVDKNYFIKILPYEMSSNEIEKTKYIYKIYKQKNIPLIPLLDIILQKDETILIYPYFEGKDLKDSNIPLSHFRTYGIKVAREVKKMNQITRYPDLFKKFNLENHCDNCINKLNRILVDRGKEVYALFSKEEITSLTSRFKELLNCIKYNDVMLNHNDIKTANIMLDKNNNFYLVDIEPIDLTYRGFNLNYSIYTFLFNDDFEEQQKQFLKGFIKEYDPNKQLIKEFEYFIISDFINELERLLDNNYSYLEQNRIFIKNVLFNRKNILSTILYE